MSAILGRIDFDGRPIDEERFRKAMESLAHYGGDDSRAVLDGNLAFGFHGRRIARRVTPDRGPLRDGPLSLVADVILDARDELADALGISAPEARQLADGTLLLRAFRAWGERHVERLAGDFAIAVHDARANRLWLFRDHIGARPLYWYRRGATVLFATDLRGLLAFSDQPWQIDEAIVAQFLANTFRPLPKTFFQDVHILPAGHLLCIDDAGVRLHKWWDPADVPEIRYRRPEDYAAGLRTVTEQAVACRVDTDIPVGSHVSGGIDSSVVTSLAAHIMRGNGGGLAAAYAWAPAISDRLPNLGRRDERPEIAEFCKSIGVACRFNPGDDTVADRHFEPWLELDGTADVVDEIPVLDRAAADGIGILLSGWGGDEAFSAHGYGYLAYLLRHLNLVQAYRVVRTYSGGLRRPRNFLRCLWLYGLVPTLPDRFYARYSPFPNHHLRSSFADPAFLDRVLRRTSDAQQMERQIADPVRYLAQMIDRRYLSARMDTWTAWAARKGIQYRYPLLDRRVIEFVLGTPPRQLFGEGQSRHLASAAFKDMLPAKLSKRDKANEAHRAQGRVAAMARIGAAARAGAFDGPCDWLDMAALKARLLEIAEDPEKHEIADFIEIRGAVSVYRLHQRQMLNVTPCTAGVHSP